MIPYGKCHPVAVRWSFIKSFTFLDLTESVKALKTTNQVIPAFKYTFITNTNYKLQKFNKYGEHVKRSIIYRIKTTRQTVLQFADSAHKRPEKNPDLTQASSSP